MSEEIELQELRLAIKQSLKFLNTFCLRLKHKVVLLTRQALQVLRAVIVFNAVKVMNVPAFRQRLTVSFFPHHNMLKNITIGGAGMLWFVNKVIAITVFDFPPFPLRAFLPFGMGFVMTISAHFCPMIARLTTLNARVVVLTSKVPIPFFSSSHMISIA